MYDLELSFSTHLKGDSAIFSEPFGRLEAVAKIKGRAALQKYITGSATCRQHRMDYTELQVDFPIRQKVYLRFLPRPKKTTSPSHDRNCNLLQTLDDAPFS